MSYTADYPIHEGYDLKIYAEVEYDIESASGDGWNEPHEPAHAYVISATLRQVEIKQRWGRLIDGKLVKRDPEFIVTHLGEAPEWVLNIVRRDTDWLTDMALEDGYGGAGDPDRWRDEMIDRELMERP